MFYAEKKRNKSLCDVAQVTEKSRIIVTVHLRRMITHTSGALQNQFGGDYGARCIEINTRCTGIRLVSFLFVSLEPYGYFKTQPNLVTDKSLRFFFHGNITDTLLHCFAFVTVGVLLIKVVSTFNL